MQRDSYINLVQGQAIEENQACPYHGPLLSLEERNTHPCAGSNSMERFLAEDPSEQSALLIRPDTGALSTTKDCTCAAWAESSKHEGS